MVGRRSPRSRRVASAPLPNWDQYAASWTSLHGGIDPRRARRSVERWLRFGYEIAKLGARAHLKPGAVTGLGLLACLFVPVFAGRGAGWTLLAAGLVAFAAITDTVDGALAVLTAHTTRLGYVYDAVVDRIGEACWLLAMWRIGVQGWIVVAASGLSWLHEYTRARANAAGMTEIGATTLGERPTRVVLAVVGFGLAGILGLGSRDLPAGVVTFAAAVWVVLGLIGFMQLFASIHRALAGRSWPTRQPVSPPAPQSMSQSMSQSAPMSMPASIPPTVIDDMMDEEFARFAAMPASTAVYTSQSTVGRHLAVEEND